MFSSLSQKVNFSILLHTVEYRHFIYNHTLCNSVLMNSEFSKYFKTVSRETRSRAISWLSRIWSIVAKHFLCLKKSIVVDEFLFHWALLWKKESDKEELGHTAACNLNLLISCSFLSVFRHGQERNQPFEQPLKLRIHEIYFYPLLPSMSKSYALDFLLNCCMVKRPRHLIERNPIVSPISFIWDSFIVIWIHRNPFTGFWTNHRGYWGENDIIYFVPSWNAILPSTHMLTLNTALNESVFLP